MPHHLPHTCPGCGLALHYPTMPSVEYVIEGLLAETGGRCPECGEQVVFCEEPPPRECIDAFATADSLEELRAVPIVDLPLSVRCRLAIFRMGLETVGDILDSPRERVCRRLRETDPAYTEDLCRLLGERDIPW